MATTPNKVLITATCLFLILATFWLLGELSIGVFHPGPRLREYLPQIFGLWFDSIVIVVIFGWWQYSHERSRRHKLLKTLTHELSLMGFVMTNAIRNSHPNANVIDFNTYSTKYASMRKSLAGLTPPQIQGVASKLLEPAQRHWSQLCALTSVLAEFGADNLRDWLEVTNKLYNVTLYAQAAKQGNAQARDAEFAYLECAALFCLLASMKIPEYSTGPPRKGKWGQ